ncbi:MAG TPA: nitroreductase family deazaflavin-dependent oxidoreductase [Acidimicrobiia bacterium]|jgi:deazaflavin-dependent oxidoreductase (nitroreductase family)
MVRRAIRTILIVVVVTAVVFVVGLRTKSPRVRHAVRRISRATRGLTIDRAGRPGAYASLVRHVGRSSGRPYETPVRAAATDDGVIITLPYGSDTDWVKNVLASRDATIVYEGNTFGVRQPEIVSDGMQYFPAKDQRTQRLFGVDEYLRLRRMQPSGG